MNKPMIVLKHSEMLEKKLKDSNDEIRELSKRVATLESMLMMAGIIERLDMSDIVSIDDNDPWSMYSNTHYKVKKVTS
jgi:hypothetical protein